MNVPKVFISYSWTSPDFENVVLGLATSLREDGVDAILDKWDLKEGQDADMFMEQMVSDPTVTKVLIICDKLYAEKSNKRTGGVGTEAQIISKRIYEQQDESKFVVATFELNPETEKPYLPIYYTSRKYIDFTNQSKYNEKYEELLRWIFNKPLYTKPIIGKVPDFIVDDERITLGTSTHYKRLMYSLQDGKSNCTGLLKEYLEIYANNLDRFRVNYNYTSQRDIASNIDKSIDNMLNCRNEWVEVIDKVCLFNPSEVNISLINHFFERIFYYGKYKDGNLVSEGLVTDNFKFIITELFLYYIAILLKRELFSTIHSVLSSRFYDENANSVYSTYDFRQFKFYPESLDVLNSQCNQQRISPLGYRLFYRADKNVIIKGIDLCQADFFLFIYSLLNCAPEMYCNYWYPSLLIYSGRSFSSSPFEVFARAESRRYFERLREALDITYKDELTECIKNLQQKDLNYINFSNGYNYNIAVLANVNNIATK